MKARNKIILILGIIIGIYLILNIINFLTGSVNHIINNPDKKCNLDSDCELKRTSCGGCDCGDAVNKNWGRVCLFFEQHMEFCEMCPSLNLNFEIKCINNECQRVWK